MRASLDNDPTEKEEEKENTKNILLYCKIKIYFASISGVFLLLILGYCKPFLKMQ